MRYFSEMNFVVIKGLIVAECPELFSNDDEYLEIVLHEPAQCFRFTVTGITKSAEQAEIVFFEPQVGFNFAIDSMIECS